MTEATARPSGSEQDAGDQRDFVSQARTLREGLECVVLPPRPEAPPTDRPPVEIYLGTEPAQYRANRVFGWQTSVHISAGRMGSSRPSCRRTFVLLTLSRTVDMARPVYE